MGKGQSSETKWKRDAYTESVLKNQRKFYEEKCKMLLEQTQSSQQAQVAKVEGAYVDTLSYQGSNTLYPNLNVHSEPQPYLSMNNVIKIPTSDITQNNYIPRSVASTSTTINSNLGSINDGFMRVTPSAPPEPSRQIQRPKKNKGPMLNKNVKGQGEFNCETCNKNLGLYIFQLTHSSCQRSKMAGRSCGKINCGKVITDMRNITAESLAAEMTLSSTASQLDQVKAKIAKIIHNNNVTSQLPTAYMHKHFLGEKITREDSRGLMSFIPERELKMSCSNRYDGCRLQFTEEKMRNHLKECPFRELACPLASIFRQCSWRGRINHLTSHFIDVHPEQCQANVDTEMSLLDIKNMKSSVYLVAMGKFNFLFNIKVDAAKQSIYFAIQFFGTSVSAAKWNYEFHVYNKSQPRRKYQQSDVCLSASVPVDKIFNANTCVVIPESYIKTFKNNGLVNYKFYIKPL